MSTDNDDAYYKCSICGKEFDDPFSNYQCPICRRIVYNDCSIDYPLEVDVLAKPSGPDYAKHEDVCKGRYYKWKELQRALTLQFVLKDSRQIEKQTL